ncbi:MAG: hypothetical protein JKY11_02660, partial [Alphaproteobacteria bacterium]|nr:hypothetical protein [Alphaproteobacteria bacterium]
LTGVATIKGERIIINGVDITNFVRAMNGDFKGINSLLDISGALYKGKTQFDTLDAKFDITKGVVNFNPVTLDGPKARFDVTGNLNLPKWTIDIKNRATVKTKGDPIPPFDMSFRGSLDNPIKSSSGGALENMLQRKLKNILNDKGITDKLNKKLGIDLFGGAAKRAPAPTPSNDNTEAQPVQEQKQEATPEDEINKALGKALGGFLGGL